MSCHLLPALSVLLPGGLIFVVSRRPWHSLTFSGEQVELSAIIAGESHSKIAAEFDQILSEHDFNPSGPLVADIAVTERTTRDQETHLVIHALLLDA
jgi:hypothetical protein